MAYDPRPIVLPQLVHDHSLREDGATKSTDESSTINSVRTLDFEAVADAHVFFGDNASVSDVTSPVTPTFSNRGGVGSLGHLRFSSSSSSLDLPLSIPSPTTYTECATSPTSVPTIYGLGLGLGIAPVPAAAGNSKLADVQEEAALEQVAEGFDGQYDGDQYAKHGPGDDGYRTHMDPYNDSAPVPSGTFTGTCTSTECGLQYHVEREAHIEHDADIQAMIRAHRISDLYDCLCDEPCSHGHNGSHGEPNSTPNDGGAHVGRWRRRTNGGSMSALSEAGEAALSGLKQRVLSRWRSASTSSRLNFAGNLSQGVNFGSFSAAPVSDTSLSHAPSSRSSSLSAGRPTMGELFNTATAMRTPDNVPPYGHDHTHAPPMSTPNLCCDNIEDTEQFPTTAGDMENEYPFEYEYSIETARDQAKVIERDRNKATTPLLPPLFINTSSSRTSPLLPSSSVDTLPRQGSAVLPQGVTDARISPMSLGIAKATATAPPGPFSVTSSAAVPSAPLEVAPAVEFDLQDAWADRLGHANHTILPRPYAVGTLDVDGNTLRQFFQDWHLARANYTEHLALMGEHYGVTSNIYELTQAKWAETESQWLLAHARLASVASFVPPAPMPLVTPKGSAPPAVIHPPAPIIDLLPEIVDEKKFPHSGEDEIVGMMDRSDHYDVPISPTTEKNLMAKFLRGLAGRVRIRK